MAKVGLHYMTAWTTDERISTKMGTDPTGRITVLEPTRASTQGRSASFTSVRCG